MILLAAAVLIAATVLVADGASKRLVHARVVHPGWGLRVVRNRRGARAGLSVAQSSALLMAMTIGLALVSRTSVAAVGAGLLVGGAAANLWDRIRHGAVLDFIALGRWPVFNVADVALVAGVLLMLVGAR